MGAKGRSGKEVCQLAVPASSYLLSAIAVSCSYQLSWAAALRRLRRHARHCRAAVPAGRAVARSPHCHPEQPARDLGPGAQMPPRKPSASWA